MAGGVEEGTEAPTTIADDVFGWCLTAAVVAAASGDALEVSAVNG